MHWISVVLALIAGWLIFLMVNLYGRALGAVAVLALVVASVVEIRRHRRAG